MPELGDGDTLLTMIEIAAPTDYEAARGVFVEYAEWLGVLRHAGRAWPVWLLVLAGCGPAAPRLLRLTGVTDRQHDEDQFVREWATFDAVAKGEPIATRADGTLLVADRDGFLIFPNTEAAPGTEWFYFAVTSERDLGRPA